MCIFKTLLSKKNLLCWNRWLVKHHIDGLVQERCNSIANTLELRLSCTNPLICQFRSSQKSECVHIVWHWFQKLVQWETKPLSPLHDSQITRWRLQSGWCLYVWDGMVIWVPSGRTFNLLITSRQGRWKACSTSGYLGLLLLCHSFQAQLFYGHYSRVLLFKKKSRDCVCGIWQCNVLSIK